MRAVTRMRRLPLQERLATAGWLACAARLGVSASGIVFALALGGCMQGPGMSFPNLAKDPRPVLTAEQQAAATKELAAKKDAEHAAALKKIETK